MNPDSAVLCDARIDEDADRVETVARVFKALSDPLRLQLLRVLPKEADRRDICVCDLAQRLKVSQPNVSHHLGILREAGLVRVARYGGYSYYYVDITAARGALSELENAL